MILFSYSLILSIYNHLFTILFLFEYSIQWYHPSIYDSIIDMNDTIKIDIDNQYSLQILVIKWNMNSILILIVLYNNHLFYQLSIFTRSARIGETSIHSFIFIQILVIDLDSTYSNERGRSTVFRLGISIHHSIIQYQTRKSHWTRLIETITIWNNIC